MAVRPLRPIRPTTRVAPAPVVQQPTARPSPLDALPANHPLRNQQRGGFPTVPQVLADLRSKNPQMPQGAPPPVARTPIPVEQGLRQPIPRDPAPERIANPMRNMPVAPAPIPGLSPVTPGPQGPKMPGPNAGLDELGFDFETDAIMRRIQKDRGRGRANLDEHKANVETDAYERRRGLERQKPRDTENMLGEFANRGMAYSGRYVKDRGDLDSRYADEFSGIDRNKARQISDAARAFADYEAQLEADEQDAILNLTKKRVAEAEEWARRNPNAGLPLPDAVTNRDFSTRPLRNPRLNLPQVKPGTNYVRFG